MSDPDQDEALAWVVRVADPDFEEWEEFDAWLAGDAARGPAYRDASAAVDEVTRAMAGSPDRSSRMHVASVETLRPRDADIPPVSSRRRGWAVGTGLALAASIAGVMLIGSPDDAPRSRILEAPLGRSAEVVLIDGTRIALAGGGRISFDPARPREVTLDRGRALFAVVHDAGSPFRVKAGGDRIVDVGTVFEVARDADVTDVAVAEGSVVVDGTRGPIPLEAGDAAILRDGASPRLLAREAGSIGRWSRDRMTYRDVPLARVAADLSIALGRPIAIGAGLRDRRFTGSLAVAAIRARPQDLAELLDVRVRADGRGLELLGR